MIGRTFTHCEAPASFYWPLACVWVAIIVVGDVSLPQVAWAQYGRTTSGGTFGGRTLGGNVTPGNRTMTNAPGNQGGVGQGFGATGVTQQASDAGSLSGNERFLRNNRQGAFVGRDLSEAGNFIGQDSGGQLSAMQDLGLLRAAAQNANANGGGAAQRSPVPVAYRVAFEHQAPAVATLLPVLSQRLTTRFARLPGSRVQLKLDNNTLVLTGSVATEHDRALALQLVALEPGVAQVRNDLLVVAKESIPAPPADVESPGDTLPTTETLPPIADPPPLPKSSPLPNSSPLPTTPDPFARPYVAPNPFAQPPRQPARD